MGKIHRLKAQAGFSLLEMMVTVAVICVIAGLALPSMVRMGEEAKIRVQLATIFHMVRTARGSFAGDDMPYVGNAMVDWCPICNCSDQCQGQDFYTDACKPCREGVDRTWRNLGFRETPKSPYGTPWILNAREGWGYWWGEDGCWNRDELYVRRANGWRYVLDLPRGTCPDTMQLDFGTIARRLSSGQTDQCLNDWPMPP